MSKAKEIIKNLVTTGNIPGNIYKGGMIAEYTMYITYGEINPKKEYLMLHFSLPSIVEDCMLTTIYNETAFLYSL